ncbi:cupin domain-containing protein [Acetivibrio straminisolvens]|jgi:quercetin dioxygenase-like cupin family protein|uniref:cupin domain-containing protein n=1 Tax=Acetivibrio straminisolvens TaxID=253314 RepID=UPI00223F633E|nr:cupin domain-containing protein [Acetivibrio straminisolvens]HOV25702.1 cupin domain-containing protein [Pseudobacteroides sp.]
MSIDNWTKVKNELIGENADMYVISSENITVSKFEFRETIDLPTHSHDSEQITVVVEGEMTIKYGEIEKKMSAGDACIIPANVPHSAKISKVPFKSYDIFYPIREDFIRKINNE